MRPRAPRIPLRRVIYLGCEGESEAGYAALLQDFARAANRPVHLNIEVLGPGAGDPLARLEMAVRSIRRIKPDARYALLDDDQTRLSPDRAALARDLASRHRIKIIWQRPCFEALLLRHLPDCGTLRPPDTQRAHRTLKRHWPDYKKPLRRADLEKCLGRDAIRRAAAVEPDLATLLRELGLIA